MTRSSLRNKIQQDLYDIVGVYFDAAMLNDSIQDGYDEIILRTQCIEATTDITFQNGYIYYDLYNCVSSCEGLPLYWRPTKMFNTQTNRWIDVVDSRFLDKYRFDWEASNGTPWFAIIWNYRWMGFFPHYVTGANQTFKMLFKVGRDVITSDTQYIQIPPPYGRTLENYVCGDMLESTSELVKAAERFADYEAQIMKLREHVASRMLPERYLQLNDLDFPYPTLP